MSGIKQAWRDCLWTIPGFLYDVMRTWDIVDSEVTKEYIVLRLVWKKGSVKGLKAVAVAERKYKNMVKFCPSDPLHFFFVNDEWMAVEG